SGPGRHVKVLIPVRIKTGAWLGGANYFLSLARALGSQPRPGGASVVIATNRPDWFESARGDAVEVRAAPWLDVTARADYVLNGLVSMLTGYNPLLYGMARQLGVAMISQAIPGRLAPCPVV